MYNVSISPFKKTSRDPKNNHFSEPKVIFIYNTCTLEIYNTERFYWIVHKNNFLFRKVAFLGLANVF